MTQTLHPVTLEDRYTLLHGRVQLTGVQALARLVLDQIRRDRRARRNVAGFVSGYEGSPLGGYDLELMRHKRLLEEHDVLLQPGLNEEAGATAVQGSQLAQTLDGQKYDGVFGVWYGKAPGLDRATDAIRHANLMGTAPTGGVLCCVGDDPGAKSSTVPCASEAALADLRMPVLYPADSQEVLDLGLHGIEMSRVSGLWTGFKVLTAVADGSSTVELDPERVKTLHPRGGGKHQVTGKLLQPTLGPLERDQVTTRLRLAAEYGRLNRLNTVTVGTFRDGVGIVAAGKTYLDLRQALAGYGLDSDDVLEAAGIRLLKVSMPFPLHPETVREFAAGLREIVVVEEKRSFLEAQVKEILYGTADAPAVTGKRDLAGAELFPEYGDLDTDTVRKPLARRLADHGVEPAAAWLQRRREAESVFVRRELPLLPRAPYFCSGCPHNTSTKPADGALVGAGIGCHAMVLLMDDRQVGQVTGVTQMGGEGTQWIGMAPFLEADHFVQNLGDGTFHHSGSLAIRAAVASGVNITYKLLYNSTVAMTGGQDAVGVLPVPRLVEVLLAEGVSRVLVTTEDVRRYRRTRLPRGVEVWDRSRLDEAQRVLAAVPGVTVLVHEQECATQKRRKRKRGKADAAKRIVINERICEGCGDCGVKSNCLSVHPVQTEFGRKTRIHQASCNTDYTCVTGDCPAFMEVEATGVRAALEPLAPLAPDTLPAPVATVPEDHFSVRLTGIGGTGVVTVSAVLATAAVMAGRHVRTLDQTGLAQKGGAVVSDVKVSTRPVDVASKIAADECDLYLSADVLAAAAEANLTVASPDRTLAVVSTTEVPTGHMVSDVDVAFPAADDTVGRIAAATRHDGSVFVDARALAEEIFGDDQYANMLLVGAAHQAGALPLPTEAVEAAITLNGVAVAQNNQAFRRGRQWVADRSGLQDTLAARRTAAAGEVEVVPGATPRVRAQGARVASLVAAEAGSELERLVSRRATELVAYADEGYARRYAEVVEEVRRAEAAEVPGSTAFAEAVAANLFKVMAYKDEYEVARLALAPEVSATLATQFGEGTKASFKLHPPTLRALGMKRKLTFGPWFRPVFASLYRMRRLRGTWADPFGRAEVRRVERRLAAEYRDLVLARAASLSPETLRTSVALAELPDLVRGYEHVKLANVEAYESAKAELLTQGPARR